MMLTQGVSRRIRRQVCALLDRLEIWDTPVTYRSHSRTPRTHQEWRDGATLLASHVLSRTRVYQKKSDTKTGKRQHLSARLSWQQACDLGFRGGLEEGERLMGGGSKARLGPRIREQEPLNPKIK
jgi:hypothetical protein